MEWMEVAALCFMYVFLGFCLCALYVAFIFIWQERRREKKERKAKKLIRKINDKIIPIEELAKEERKCETCKHFEKGIEEEPCDICDEETKDMWEVRR